MGRSGKTSGTSLVEGVAARLGWVARFGLGRESGGVPVRGEGAAVEGAVVAAGGTALAGDAEAASCAAAAWSATAAWTESHAVMAAMGRRGPLMG